MQLSELESILYNKRRFAKKCGRDIMKIYTPLLDYPERGMKIIHIAGTNGKGSTSAAIEAVLRAAGFHTGLFTSPHLVRFNERFKVDGRDISDEDLLRYAERILSLDVFEESSMFDDTLAIALLYFKEKKVDYVILETGIGGRLDSTAGLSEIPILSVITRIGLDHTEILGNTIEEIAGEKAGILKKGTTLILGANEKAACDVILNEAGSLDVEVVPAENTDIDGYELSLKGSYQKENMKTALTAVRKLTEIEGIEIPETAIRNGLASVSWPGRMQLMGTDPLFYIDGAHNPNGVEALRDTLLDMYPGQEFIFVTAVLSDKDYMDMYRIIYPLSDTFFTVTVQNNRAYSGERLADELKAHGKEAVYCSDIATAIGDAKRLARAKHKTVVAFGSLYFIGEILGFLDG